MAAIEAGVRRLYKLIARTWRKCCRADESDDEPTEDKEMVDAEAAPTEAAKEKGERPIRFELAIVGGKKNDEDEDMA